MSFTYNNDPSESDIAACRFIIGDTNSSMPLMQDEEIQYIIDNSHGTNDLYYQLFSRAATLYARDIKRSLGPQSEDPTERTKFFSEQAAIYKAVRNAAGISVPLYASRKIFFKGMNNNPPNIPEGRWE